MSDGKVEIQINTNKFDACNCCASIERPNQLWDVEFKFNNHTTIIRLCEKHLEQLRDEVTKALG
ncbi:hypothetical protein NST17_21175 [Caldifermentibacillus hisashii]|uniref:Uncharacterized protein n=1 Tax=Caldifermentibacillus hisashii TaxID=996558 RepID=A0ABU9K6M2_9BACI